MTVDTNQNILVIDSDTKILDALKNKLQKEERFDFFGATNLAQAKELVANNSFFAAVVDMELPDANIGEGVEFTTSNLIPTIALAHTITPTLRSLIVEKEVVDYVAKDGTENIGYIANLLSNLLYLSKQTALVIDDSRASCKMISESLKLLLLKTIECTNPLDAIGILQDNEDIKLVTVDYEMPHIKGVELTKKIRSTFTDRNLAIFGISASNSDEIKYGFLKNGASSYFIKPFITEEFSSKIINHMKIIEQKEKLNAYIAKVDEYIITSTTDRLGNIQHVSKAFCDISGYSKDELIGKRHSILRHPDMDPKAHKEIWDTLSNGKKWSGEIKNKKKNGDYYWVKANIEPTIDSSRNIVGYQSVQIDITDKKRIEKMSITDELTGLYNRRFFNTKIAEELSGAKEQKTGFAFFIMDVDNFKKYNDTYGHKMGDDVLKRVGRLLKEMLSMEGDTPFRLGGEEFGAIVGANDAQEAMETVNAIRESLEGLEIEHTKNNVSRYVTASFGLFFIDFALSQADIDAQSVYISADKALYEAKEGGRNRVSLSKI